MLQRNVLLIVGCLALLAGLTLSVLWVSQSESTKVEKPITIRELPAILAATHPIITGSLLRPEDMMWKEVTSSEIAEADLVRGKVSEAEFIGAVTRRDFAEKEAFNPNALVKPRDRGFLSAVLSPGYRAVSIAVDAAQGDAGLVMPGDRVDIILTQNLSDTDGNAAHKSVGETVLFNRRVIAVDRTLPASPKVVSQEVRIDNANTGGPRTVTLELTQREAEQILVATQLGKVALSVRALEGAGVAAANTEGNGIPVWASDVSPALKLLNHTPAGKAAGSESRGLIEIIHGDKTEMR